MGAVKKSHNKRCIIIVCCVVAMFAALVIGLVFWLKDDGAGTKDDVTTQAPNNGNNQGGGTDPASGEHPSQPYSAYDNYRYAAVTADADPCSQIGVNVMAKKGGTAVDAAIATIFCVGVVNCHSSGVGGGLVMTIYEYPRNDSTRRVANTIIGRERAPLQATQDMYVNVTGNEQTVGGKAIGVPGEVKGLYHAWQKFGQVDWAELIAPTIILCKTGFTVNPALAYGLSRSETYIRNDTNLREVFMDGENLAQVGDVLTNLKYGATLEKIAENPEAFYDGDSQLNADILADIADYGGIITQADLTGYEVYDQDPVELSLKNGGYTVYSTNPPTSGVILEYILNILDGYNFTADDIADKDTTVNSYHRIIEAFKFAYAKRSELGDAAYVELDEFLRNLTSSEFAADIKKHINETHTQDISYYEPSFEIKETHGTAHMSVLSARGSAVSLTSTINYYLGSKTRGSRTGIIFNNQMDDFSTPGSVNGYGVPASPSNFIEPGKVPVSSMCPTIITDQDGNVKLVTGASGGTRITTATAFVIMHSLWFGKAIHESTDMPRLHHQLAPNEVWAEYGFDQGIKSALKERGHTFVQRGGANVQSVHETCSARQNFIDPYNDLCIEAVSDKRKAGHPDGY